MAVQRTQKVVVMGCHNFKDEPLIFLKWACQKMNATGKKF
jgi:hypothetical protein